MTRKDFELIANVLNNAHVLDFSFDESPHIDLYEVAQAFAKALAETNPRFDSERFLNAVYAPKGTPC